MCKLYKKLTMFLQFKLARRFFAVVASILLVLFLIIYWYSVPLIKDEVYQVERNASRLALNNVFEIARHMHLNVEDYENDTVQGHKAKLVSIVNLTSTYIDGVYRQAVKLELSEAEARQQVFQGLRNFNYGKDDYIWIANKEGRILSHPDSRFHGADKTDLQGLEGGKTLQEIIDLVTLEGEGFYQYRWHRLNEPQSSEKLSYVKFFPEWGFFVGTGFYLDDIVQEVSVRKKEALADLRQALDGIRIAKTGYLFIFDGQGNMLVHPNPNIDETNALALKDPTTNRSILGELKEVADTGNELKYKWDRPSDPGNYVYDKLSLVRYHQGFDWYICSSVYVEELQASSETLSKRILGVGLVGFLFAIALAFYFVKWVTRPISRLADTARKVTGGDLTVTTGIQRNDELGILAEAFDGMVRRLRGNIQTLDDKVEERTLELKLNNIQLAEAVHTTQQAQSDLIRIEARQRRILESLPAEISYMDDQLTLLFANELFLTRFATRQATIEGQHLKDAIGKESFEKLSSQIRRCRNGEEMDFTYTQPGPRGERIIRCVLIPELSEQGSVTGILNLSMDVTAEKAAEKQLAAAQRMNAVGQLAGGLAHDFNNLLTIILGNLKSAERAYAQDSSLLKKIVPAIRAATRGGQITSRLLAFSRRQSLLPSRVKLPELIDETVELVQGSLSSRIQLRATYQNSDPQLFIDAGQLENCLVNLVLNARDAIYDRGEIEISLSEVSVGELSGYDEPVIPGNYVQITVSDTGSGFSEQALTRGIEPFFTTKANEKSDNRKGSGLGLSMVYGFIKQSEGYIRLENHANGARVILLLPVTRPVDAGQSGNLGQRTGSVDPAKPIPEESSGESNLVLLVEDEEDVRQVVREMLVDQGYAVLEAPDADEAATLIHSIDNLFGMVSDISMPGKLNGYELAAGLRAINPHAAIVLISGYAFDESAAQGHSDFRLLKKPFEVEELASALAASRPELL